MDAGAVDYLLLDIQVKDKVIRESLVLSQQHLGLSGGYGGADMAALDLLFRHLRTNPARKTDMYKQLYIRVD